LGGPQIAVAGRARFSYDGGMSRRITLWVLAGLAAAAFAWPYGCSKDAGGGNKGLTPGTHDLTLAAGGRERTYRLHVPTGYSDDSAWPLVVALHGGGGTGPEMETLSGFSALADEKGFLVAYPNGCMDNHWADGRGTTPPDTSGVNDVAFIDALITRVSIDANVDPKRIYACGFSNGSMMTSLLGCDLSSRLAAIGGCSGQLADSVSDHLLSEPIGLVYFHGTDDPVVPYDGGLVLGPYGGRVMSASDLGRFWVAADGCDTIPTVFILPDVDPGDGTRVAEFVYGGGAQGTEVRLYRVQNGGHAWPGASVGSGVTHDVDATRLMWAFFETQHK
jgi:polyhydroxybutyrate depolymerase